MGTCKNHNCGVLLANTIELEKHKSYHGGINNPYLSNHEALQQRITGAINRRTIAGWGIHKNDITAWNGVIRYSVNENKWTCAICGYNVGPWGRTGIAGHVASTHGYTAGIPNERRNIPHADQRNKTNKDTHKKNKRNAALDWEIKTGKISKKNTEEDGKIWECNNCTYTTNNPKDLYSHTARMHRKTTIGNARCPYCPMPLANINNLKTHIRTKTCPLIPQNTTEQQHWADICKKKPKETPDEHKSMRNQQRRGPAQMMMGIFYDRIKPNTKNNKENWHCARCKKGYANEKQILKHMNKEHNEITRGAAHCPFCNKHWPRIIHAQQHVTTGNCTVKPPHLNGPRLWNHIVKLTPHTHTYIAGMYADKSIMAP